MSDSPPPSWYEPPDLVDYPPCPECGSEQTDEHPNEPGMFICDCGNEFDLETPTGPE